MMMIRTGHPIALVCFTTQEVNNELKGMWKDGVQQSKGVQLAREASSISSGEVDSDEPMHR